MSQLSENKNLSGTHIPKITSVCISYNEESNMERYLNDVSFADEIIVVDSYSTDKTKEIAEKNPEVKFLQRKFDNFTNQKNFAIEQASYEWIIFFDLDEHIPDSLKKEIIKTASSPNAKDAYWIYRKFFFLDKYIKYSGWQNDKAIRLFKKGKAHYTHSKLVHETMVYDSKPGFLKNKLDHYSFNSLESYRSKLNQYSKLKAEEYFSKNVKPNFYHKCIKPAYRFFQHYIIQLGILDGKEGLVISKLYAEYVANQFKYLEKLWEEKKD